MSIEPVGAVSRANDEAELLARATLVSGIGAWRCQLSDDRLAWTEGVYKLFGVSTGTALDRRDIVLLYDEQSRETVERVRSDAIKRRSGFQIETRIVRPDTQVRWIRISAKYDPAVGPAGALYGLKQDITEERARLEALQQLADCDALTGLGNRGAFQRSFFKVDTDLGALVLIDIDGFKPINDRYGHAAGDACLIAVAQRLRASFSDAMIVSRIGGDEFAIMIEGNSDRVAMRVGRLLQDLSLPIVWGGELLTLTASAGIALRNSNLSESAEAVFAAADAALYAAKRSGRNRLTVAPLARHEQASLRAQRGNMKLRPLDLG